jgi:murein DD-endopeptidase MepM/ murein hydrolase activator NlpD
LRRKFSNNLTLDTDFSTLDKMKKRSFIRFLWHRFLRTIRRMDRIGRETVTVMVVPAPHAPMRNISFRWYMVIGTATLAFALFLVNIFVLSDWTSTHISLKTMKVQEKELLSEKKLMKKDLEKLSRSLEDMKPEVSRMLYLAKADKKEFYDAFGMGGSSADALNAVESNELKIPDSELYIKKLDNEVRITREVITRINNYISQNQNIFDKLPVMWPMPDGGYVTSEFGLREHPIYKGRKEIHRGLDIANYPGAPIVATADGTVVFSGYDSQFGFNVIVMHAFGFTTRYGHCSRLKVRAGQPVKRGQVIAYVGQTGAATGYHLHYEMRIGSTAIDPWPYILRMK